MSMLSIAELLGDASLGLELVAGSSAVDCEIEAAAVSELSHPGPWLQGGELLLTIGLLLPDSTDGCSDYLAELRDAGVRAVGLGLGAELPHQRAPDRLVAAADTTGMPLLTVPDGVPFIAVTKAVFAFRARAERRTLERTLQTQRALTAAAVSPGGLLGILNAHREATGRAGVIVDQLDRILAQTDPDGDRLVERMAGPLASVRDHGLAAAAVDISEGRRRELHALGAQRLRAWLLIDGSAELPAAEQITGDLVSLLSLELERRHGLNSAQRRERAQVLDRLARGTVDDTVAARWLASLGLKDADQRAAAISAPDDAEELAADLLTTLRDALVRVVGNVVEVTVPLATDLPGALATLAPDRPAGIGIEVRPGAVAVSLRQARSALPASRVQGRHLRAEEIASSRMLLNAVGPDSLAAYTDAVLGPLDATDRATDLLRGLTAFLENNGHWAAAASALRVHRHTMRNRIETVERLTGRRMESAQDRHELWLALRARDIAGLSTDPAK
jgi:purine catabolism regulator